MTHATPPLLASALARARRRLGPDSGSEPEILLAHVLGKNRTYLHTWPERALTSEEFTRFDALLERRAAGEPIAYLLGRREFWSLDLAVTSATLIPRADTEVLVTEALARIPAGALWRVADLGTGSGAIALAIAHERPATRVVATDASAAALAVAQENARRLDLTNVEFRAGSWFAPLAQDRFQLIASNPPYIPEADPHLSMGDLRFEPRAALAAGKDGLTDLRLLIAGAPDHLESDGWLLLEHGYDQGPALRVLMRDRGFLDVQTYRDLENRDRVTAGRYR
jgi:release factor glutamine methyltransferase